MVRILNVYALSQLGITQRIEDRAKVEYTECVYTVYGLVLTRG